MSEIILKSTDRIVTKTDLKGKIIYANKRFIDICKYSLDELIGKSHNIIRHEDMPRAVFKFVWDEIKANREAFGFVKNKAKNGDHYWVMANIIPSQTAEREKVYTSFRIKPNVEAIQIVESLYNEMLRAEEEKGGDISSGMKVLESFLAVNNLTYNELIYNLQTKGKIK